MKGGKESRGREGERKREETRHQSTPTLIHIRYTHLSYRDHTHSYKDIHVHCTCIYTYKHTYCTYAVPEPMLCTPSERPRNLDLV